MDVIDAQSIRPIAFEDTLSHAAWVLQLQTKTQLADLASQQHGAISLQQLQDIGVGRGLVDARCGSGEWARACKTVIVVSGSPDTIGRQLWIAYLSKDKCFISGRSAAAIHRFGGSRHPARPEITVPYSGDARSSVAKVSRSEFFGTISTTRLNGLDVTTPAETMFTISQWIAPRRVARLVDDLLISEPSTITELEQIYLRYQGHRVRGMGTMRPIILERSGHSYVPTESELEALAWDLFTNSAVPDLERQSPMPWAPGAGRVDLYVPTWRLIVELDGRQWHTRTEDFENDRARDNAATAAGFSVMRFTWDALTTEPDKCLRLVNEFGSRISR